MHTTPVGFAGHIGEFFVDLTDHQKATVTLKSLTRPVHSKETSHKSNGLATSS